MIDLLRIPSPNHLRLHFNDQLVAQKDEVSVGRGQLFSMIVSHEYGGDKL